MSGKPLATCNRLADLPQAMQGAESVNPQQGVTVPEVDEEALAKQARDTFSPAKAGPSTDAEATPEVGLEAIPDRLPGNQYTAKGLAKELGLTVDQVLLLDCVGKGKELTEALNMGPGSRVSRADCEKALAAQPEILSVPSPVDTPDEALGDQGEGTTWIGILQAFLHFCSTGGIGEFKLFGDRVFYRPTTLNRVWTTQDALKVAYPSIDSTDHEIVVVISGAEHVNPEDLDSVMDALDERFTNEDGTRRDAWLVSKTYQEDLQNEWGDPNATFWSEFNRAVGEVLDIPLSDSGRDYLARRIVSIQLLSGAVGIDDLLGLTPQQLIELDPHYVERPSSVQSSRQRSNIPSRPVASDVSEPAVAVVTEPIDAEVVLPEPSSVDVVEQTIDAEAVDQVFSDAADAFLDVLQNSGLLDTLPEEEIKTRFAQLLGE